VPRGAAGLIYEALGIVVAEDRRAPKLAALAHGITSGLLARARFPRTP